jgi:hypothetical protein
MEETFSTSEGAEILQISVERLRTWLRRVPNTFTAERKAGEWRHLMPDTLLALVILQLLMNKGIELEDAAAVLSKAFYIDSDTPGRLSMSGGEVALVLDFDADGRIAEQYLLSVKGCREHIYSFINAGSACLFINLVPIKIALRNRIEGYRKAQKDADTHENI